MNQYTDAMITTRSVLSETQFDEVAGKVKNIDGIGNFSRSKHFPRAILITYNSGKLSAFSILNQFSQLGYNASLVGM